MTDQTVIRTSNSNDDYLQKLRDAHPMECYRKALQKIASKRYGCCGADRIAQEALGNETGERHIDLDAVMWAEVKEAIVKAPRFQEMYAAGGMLNDAVASTVALLMESTSEKAEEQRPNVFTHGLTLSKTDIDDICGTGDLYGGKALLACGCIDICTNQRDHMPPAQSEKPR